ncbi:TAXI family TRAP transporter solute-binding subunit [Lentibacillus sp. L22]|uniref:TAXI family TRAP transporter solute-binding subunit n=1 Tax=Lentibacillus sp. L22 TaxID=3163028 RepID=UPI003465D7FA
MRVNKFYLFIGLVSLLLVVSGCSDNQETIAKKADKEKTGLPDQMTWSVYDVGSGGYTEMSAIANMLINEYGTGVRMLPSSSGVARMIPLREGFASIGKVGDEVQFSFEALEEFAQPSWGPQNVRAVWAPPSQYAFAVRENSGIETIADLKGKKVPKIVGNSSVNFKTEALLAFGGLTWDDVEVISMTSYSGESEALVQGQIDVVGMNPTASAMIEADSKVGLHWLEMEKDNKEGWDRTQELAPWLFPEETNTAVGADGPVTVPNYGYMIAGYADQDPDTIYALTKAMVEHFDQYKGASANLTYYAKDEVLTEPIGIPFHKGTIRYFKENGMWSEEKEAKNNALIKRYEGLREAWEQVKDEAKKKQISDEAFPTYWLKRKEELLQQ